MHAQLPLLAVLAAAAAPMFLSARDVPKEFGSVRWQRRLEPALESAAESKKPVLLLFQEVPG